MGRLERETNRHEVVLKRSGDADHEEPGIGTPNPATRNPKPETRNPITRNLKQDQKSKSHENIEPETFMRWF